MLLNLLYSLNGLVMIVAPLVLATFIARRYGPDWGLFGAGALTFIGSQLFHIPFNLVIQQSSILPADLEQMPALVIMALFYGLSAGVFEEIARFITYRFWARDARIWERGLMLGAGHGGVESIIVGLLFTVNILFLAGLQAGYFTAVLPQSVLQPAVDQATIVFQAPWHEAILGAVERLFSIAMHLSLSLLVMQSLTRNNMLWLFAAIGWHTAANTVAIVSLTYWGIYAAEGFIGFFALISLLLIYYLRDGERSREAPALAVEPPSLQRIETEISAEKLDESRYR